MSLTNRNCDICNTEYTVKIADLKRGWGRCCSKSCAAIKRTNKKDGYKKKYRRTEEGYIIKDGVAYDGTEPVYRTSYYRRK